MNSNLRSEVTAMPSNRQEIIEDLELHIRRSGGDFSDWCVGAAKDARGPFFERRLAAELGDKLAYREAYTTDAAAAVIDHLVNKRGLRLNSEAVSEPGKIVFLYRHAL